MGATVIPGGPHVPAELDNAVRTDGTTIGGNGTTQPLFAIGGGGGVVITDDTLTGDGTVPSPLGVDSTNLAGKVAVEHNGTLTGDGTTGDPLGVVAQSVAVATDATLTGNGTAGSPLHVVGGGSSTVHTNNTLTGDGSIGTPLGVVGANLSGTVPVAVDGTTIGGNGLTATSLHVIPAGLDDAVAVAVDGTTIGGNGKTGTSLHVIGGGLSGQVPVATDATLTGNGTTGSPLHVVTQNLLAIYTPPTPADGGTVALHAGAVNQVDIQNISGGGLLLQLPAASSVPAGTPLVLSLANRALTGPQQRGPFTIPPGIFGMNAIIFTTTGGDTINTVPTADIFASFTKSGDYATLYSDGVSDWTVTQASWVNVTRTQVTLAASAVNQISTEATGPVPNQLFLTANEDGDAVISLSAGSFNQQVMVVNVGTHSILLQPGSATPRTNNCCYLAGTEYNLAPGSAVMLQFGQPKNGGTPNLWWIQGQTQVIAAAQVVSNAITTNMGFSNFVHSAAGRYQLTLAGTPPADANCVPTITLRTLFSVNVAVAATVSGGVLEVFFDDTAGSTGIDADFYATVTSNA